MSDERKELTEKEREELRQTLRSKIHASKINRMDKKSREATLGKFQKKIQKEIGKDYDINKVMQIMAHNGQMPGAP